MNKEHLIQLLREVEAGKTTAKRALEKLKTLPYENVDFARIDNHRSIRNGIPEVIFAEGKNPEQILTLIKKIHQTGQDTLATRVAPDVHEKLKRRLPAKTVYNETARTLTLRSGKAPAQKSLKGSIAIVTAGTADIPVAEEAAVTAELFGSRVEKLFDVGVAGLHRLLDNIELLQPSRVVIVVAGMDGALPSVAGGLLSQPVIAVPTSVGYGASFNGLAPLLTMLNSCASGVAVVNIDNGFGAGCLAHKINLMGEPEAPE